MSEITFRFYEELNDFLPAEKRKRDFHEDARGQARVGARIRAQGVPLSRIDLVLVNGESVDFEHPLREGDRVSVYPVFETLEMERVSRLRKKPLRRTCFLAGGDMAELAKYLRLMGFDVLDGSGLRVEQLVDLSASA